MGDLLRPVAVARRADVVPLLGVSLEAVPALLEHVYDVPLGDALLDSASQHLGGRLGSAAGVVEIKRLIGSDPANGGKLSSANVIVCLCGVCVSWWLFM